MPAKPADFVDGLATIAGSGDPAAQSRARGARLPRQPLDGRALLLQRRRRADVRAAAGPSASLFTELGKLELQPGEIAVVPRGMKFKVGCWKGRRAATCARTTARRFACPSSARSARRASRRRATSWRRWRPSRRRGKCELVAKFMGGLWASAFAHSPLDVVAWHGDYVPYKYDLARFMAINTVSFDHAGPVDLHRAHLAFRPGRRRQLRFRHLPAALAGGRGYVPPAVVPPQRDERADGPGARRSTTPRPRASCPAASRSTTACRRTGRTSPPSSKASAAELKPHKIEDTLAFMWESRYVFRPTRFAMSARSCRRTTTASGSGFKRARQ